MRVSILLFVFFAFSSHSNRSDTIIIVIMMMMHSNNNRLKRADSNGNSRRCSVVFNITIPSDDRHPSNVDDQTKFLDW